jgi:hypothetical protein
MLLTGRQVGALTQPDMPGWIKKRPPKAAKLASQFIIGRPLAVSPLRCHSQAASQ